MIGPGGVPVAQTPLGGVAPQPPPIVTPGVVAPPAPAPAPAPPAPVPNAPALQPPGPPPALQSPGALSGPAAAPGLAQKVLVGFLVTFQNEPSGSFWALYSGRTVLGRAGAESKADVGINDASASSRHAVITADPATGQAFIEDHGSRNGTFLNEERLQSGGAQKQVHDNDRLRCGSTTFVVKLLVS